MSYTPKYTISNTVVTLVAEISQNVGRYQLQLGRNKELMLRRKNRIRTVQGSVAIEQNTLTLEQVTAVLSGKHVIAPPRDILEVRNAFAAYDELENYAPYSLDDLLRAHGIMMRHLMDFPGCFREKQVGVSDGEGNILHYGTLPRYVPQVMEELMAWLKKTDTHPLVKSCVFHFELENIHPFEDGNGRIGRLWHTLILSKWNDLFLWLPVESIIRERQSEYYSSINRADATNDACAFIEFMLNAILDVLKSAIAEQTENVKVENETSIETRMKRVLGAESYEKFLPILSYLQENGSITGKQAMLLLGKSRATAFRYLKILEENQLIFREGNTNRAAYYLKNQTEEE